MTLLEARHLSKTYEKGHAPAVNDVSLSVKPGELLTLLGPSGCGKTTLLRMLAGFETPDDHADRSIELEGTCLASAKKLVKPEKRQIGFVFQDYALFPHMSVKRNLEFGLKGLSRKEKDERIQEALEMVHMEDYLHRRPHQLSGGQQQRIALARALAIHPKIILLDEPFSGLDAAHRARTRTEVRALLKRKNIAAILVTHDQEEAMSISDRVAVMKDGVILQDDAPEVLYRKPKTAFVAKFLGRTNLIEAYANGVQATCPLGVIELDRASSGKVLVSLRPEDLHLQQVDGKTQASIIAREFMGASYRYWVEICEIEVNVLMAGHCGLMGGEGVMVIPSRPAVVVEDDR